MIKALFAIDDVGSMGYNNSLPWPRNKEDMIWFKTITEGQVVAMGKNTFQSSDMPTPLPKRKNVVFANQFIDNNDIKQVKGSIPDALIYLQNEMYEDNDIFVIGGPTILMQARPVIKEAFITRIPGEFLSDTKIDIDDFLVNFRLIEVETLNTCEIEIWENESAVS